MTDERDRLLAEKARIEAELAKLDAEPDWEAWRPALQAMYEVDGCGMEPSRPLDGSDRRNIEALIAAAPLMPRDAGMTDAEIGELADRAVRENYGGTPKVFAIAAIRETLKRAPQVRWPGEARELLWRCHQLLERNIETKTRHDLEEQRLVVDLRAHLTGEGK